ncbi:hypothetical protein BW14_06945 [Bifidobacterium sp. UTBIF-68]|uniref:hypothetical protein n=1 Tax=Bifidobacterium sp. UTBIF-68 TaxID=1465262 RepID=UPI001126D93E|nr:hypothetical protein [Bifidobacterium sp. UTBIF-68]TPF92894.1 hypothetical protein BW14_06945 [Bifidobacterium sp. UTBIF-68]
MEYIIYQHTDMTEVRKLVDVPDDLQPAELPEYVDSHGAGDLLDICDDITELVHVETKDGKTVWDRPRVQPVSATLAEERQRIARHIDD